MKENDPQLSDDLRKALKASPTWTPPESFYQGVIAKMKSAEKRAAVPPTPWYFGYPAKALTAACILLVMVLVTRQTHKTQPELFEKPGADKNIPVTKTESTFAGNAREERREGQEKDAFGKLSESKEVQERVNHSIVGYVDNPSPFEETDNEIRKDLLKNKPARADAPSSPLSSFKARDSVNASVAQEDFQQKKVSVALGNAGAMPFLGATAKGLRQKEAQEAQEWKGTISGIPTFQLLVIKTPEQWQALWARHASYIVPPPPAPDLDFETQMVIGVFAGTKVTAGFGVEITDIQTLSGKLVVTYRQTLPPAGMAATQMLTEPYDLKVIPKTNLPVVFESGP